jgi:drug/metabolite transporter (DMT)-like permease
MKKGLRAQQTLKNGFRKLGFHPYAIIAIVLWALAYVVTRLALRHFSVFSLGALRHVAASMALLIAVPLLKIRPPNKKDWGWFLLSGATGFGVYTVIFNKGIETINAATSSTVISTVPIFAALFAVFIYKERLKPLQWLSIAAGFTGVAVLALLGGEGGLSLNEGIIWSLGAAFIIAFYNLIQRRLTKTYTPMQATAYSIFLGTLMLLVFLPGSVEEAAAAPAEQIVYVLFLGIFPSAVGFFCWSKALAVADKTSSVTNYMFVTPFLTAVLGFYMAGEHVDAATIAGGGIVILSLVLYKVAERRVGQ